MNHNLDVASIDVHTAALPIFLWYILIFYAIYCLLLMVAVNVSSNVNC